MAREVLSVAGPHAGWICSSALLWRLATSVRPRTPSLTAVAARSHGTHHPRHVTRSSVAASLGARAPAKWQPTRELARSGPLLLGERKKVVILGHHSLWTGDSGWRIQAPLHCDSARWGPSSGDSTLHTRLHRTVDSRARLLHPVHIITIPSPAILRVFCILCARIWPTPRESIA